MAIIYVLGYQTPRDNFGQFIFLFLASFALFYSLSLNRQEWNFKFFLVIAIAVRLLLLLAAPELSNDFYRFIWDGELITKGINPYAHTPNELMDMTDAFDAARLLKALITRTGADFQPNFLNYDD